MGKTFLIAEAGSTHDGKLEQAERLVDLAAEIGADAAKFQWTSSPERLVERRRAPEYLDAYRLIAFPRDWLAVLAERCSSQDIEFLCTCYLPEDLPVIAPFVKRFKVASFEATDVPFVALHGVWPDKRLVISAGMGANLRESLRAYCTIVNVTASAVVAKQPLSASSPYVILHCVSAYPCPDEEINLARLRWYGSEQDPPRGLSDHTLNPWTGALAVAAGAEVIEFHVRLAETSPGNPDYEVARNPDEAAEYVANVRQAERMMGDGRPGARPCEKPMERYRVVTS